MPMAFDYRSTAAGAALEQLLETLPLERGRQLLERDAAPRLGFGLRRLDDALGGGLELGAVCELQGPPGCGKLSLALAACRQTLASGERVALVDGSRSVLPPVREEPCFERLLVVRAPEPATALVALDALLRTRAFALLLLDLGDHARALAPAALARLLREPERAGCPLLVLAESPRPLAGRSPLVIEVRRARGGLSLELRSKSAPPRSFGLSLKPEDAVTAGPPAAAGGVS